MGVTSRITFVPDESPASSVMFTRIRLALAAVAENPFTVMPAIARFVLVPFVASVMLCGASEFTLAKTVCGISAP